MTLDDFEAELLELAGDDPGAQDFARRLICAGHGSAGYAGRAERLARLKADADERTAKAQAAVAAGELDPFEGLPDYSDPLSDQRDRLAALIKHEVGCSEATARRAIRFYGTDLERARREAGGVAQVMFRAEQELERVSRAVRSGA